MPNQKDTMRRRLRRLNCRIFGHKGPIECVTVPSVPERANWERHYHICQHCLRALFGETRPTTEFLKRVLDTYYANYTEGLPNDKQKALYH